MSIVGNGSLNHHGDSLNNHQKKILQYQIHDDPLNNQYNLQL